MTRAQIQELVVEILIRDGPDGHCDGAEVITDFIVALRAGRGRGKIWARRYREAGERK